MKILIVLVGTIAWLASVLCSIDPISNNIANVMMEAKNFMEDEKNSQWKDEIEMLMKDIEIVKELSNFNFESNGSTRKKRQATPVNCTGLQIRLADTQKQITILEAKVVNITITLNTLKNQVAAYELRVSTTTGSAQTSAKNLLAIYQKLLSSTIATSDAIKKQLDATKLVESQIKNDIQIYCILSTTTTPRPAVSSPCGTFVKFDSINDRKGPETDGFAGGLNILGQTTYVGFANGASCNQLRIPCALSTNINSPGCSIPCGANEILESNLAFYLQKNPNLAWVSTTSTTLLNIPNALKLVGPSNFRFGRAKINGVYVLGKVQAGNGVYLFEAFTSNGPIQLKSNFEVLTCFIPCGCTNSSSTTSSPTTTTQIQTASPNIDTLNPGQSLTPGGSITSMDGTSMTLQNDGNLVIKNLAGQTTFTSNTAGKNVSRLTMEPNGVLVLYNSVNNIVWSTSSMSSPIVPGSSARISNGNLIIFSGNQIIFNSGTTSSSTLGPVTTSSPTTTTQIQTASPTTDTLNPGQNLTPGGSITSIDGTSMTLQTDGNLVVKNLAGQITYTSNTAGSNVTRVTMEPNGVLVLYNSANNIVWSTSSMSSPIIIGSSARVSNGNLIIFNGNQTSFNSGTISSSTLAPITTASVSSSIIGSSTITPKPCGTFVKYDIVNGRTDPELYGVLGGIDYRDGSLQYVGYGNNNNPAPCAGQNPCPGYINTNATAPGIYMSCAHGLFRDTQSVYYLEDHPDLMWVATNSANMMSVPNTIKLAMDQQWPFMFGRTTYNGQLTLGKAHAGNTFFLLNFFTTFEERYLDNFEVLTCTPGNKAQRLPVKPTTLVPTPTVPTSEPLTSTVVQTTSADTTSTSQSTSNAPIVCPVSSCGSFIKYDIVKGQSDPETCGFLAGQYVDGTSVYVGYAENTPCNGQTNIPARIKTSNPNPGAYLSRCGPEVYEPNTAYYLQKNDKLVWVKATKATLSSINNALSIKAGDFTIYYARVNMTSTTTVYTQIGKAEAALVPGSRFNYIGTWAFSHSKNAEEEVFDYEILTCIPDQQTTIATTSTSQATTSTSQSTTETTTVITTETSTANPTTTTTAKPCGTFVKYDIVNGRTDPELYGVLGGIDYRDGSLQYVGYGNNNNPAPCAGQNPCPGYINTNATAPGIYMSCAHGLFRDTQSVYYLEDHPDLMWVATNSANMMSVPNTIKLAMDQQWPFMFGRTTYNGQLTLGKAHAGNTFFLLNFFTTQEERYLDNFEVLTCTPGNTAQRLPVKPTTLVPTPTVPTSEPLTSTVVQTTSADTSSTSQSTSNAPIVCPVSSCGSFIKYDIVKGQSDPETCGFLAGQYVDGTSVYVGYAENTPCNGQTNIPARIKTSNPNPGAYLSRCGPEVYEPNTAYYLQKNDKLVWVKATKATLSSINNALSIKAGDFTIYYARVNMTSTTTVYTQIGKAEAALVPGSRFNYIGTWAFSHSKNAEEEVFDYEILTCIPDQQTTIATTSTSQATTSTSQSTTETTTVITTETSTANPTTTTTAKPCGTFVKYDIVNGRTDPELYGVLGGIDYRDGSLQYVGYGNNDNPVPCGGQNPCPGYINTNATAPGIYMSCFHGLFRDTESVYYLEDHPDLMWVATNSANMMGVPNTIKLAFDQQWPFMFGRTTYNGQLTLGKVHAGTPYFFLHIFSYREEKILDNFEVLTCTPGNTAQRLPVKPSPTQSTTIQPASTTQITCPVSSCGTFVKYDIVNGQSDPENCGFLAGQYVDGTSVYVGYAENTPCNGQTNIPARIKTSNPNPGAYLARCGPEVYEPNTAYYLQKNDKLVWVKTTKATLSSISNALSIKAGDFTIYYARVNMTSTATVYTQIGKAEAALVPGSRFNYIGTWAFSHSKNAEEEVFDYEILTCIPDQQTTIAATSTSQTTTSTTLSTTTITSKPCGTFVKYDIVNGRTDPELYGVLGGIDYRDGSLQYVGYGNNNNPAPCAGQNPCPGYINTNATAPGIYMSCAHGLFRDTQSVYYLEDHPDLMWVATNSANMMSVPNTIKLAMDQQWPFMFGRTTFNGQLTLGKAHAGNTFFLLNFFTTFEERYLDNFEVLTCTPGNTAQRLPVKPTTLVPTPTVPTSEPLTTAVIQTTPPDTSSTSQSTTETTTSTPQTTTSTTITTTTITAKPCGTFVKYDIVNGRTDPELYGVLGGIDYRDGSLQYVGYGNNDNPVPCGGQNPCPGYINTNATAPGIYMSCFHGLFRDTESVYYLEDHPDLMWVATNSANMMGVPNTIKLAFDQQWPFMFGRTTYNGQLTLGKVHAGTPYFFLHIFSYREEKILDNFEVLTCTPGNTAQRLPVKPSPTQSTTIQPASTTQITCPVSSCGTFVKYDIVNGQSDPENCGFLAGQYVDGTSVYVGYAENTPCNGQTNIPARIKTSNPNPGAYLARCGPEVYEPNTAYYLQKNDKLVWVKTTKATLSSISNALSIKAGDFTIYYARVNMTSTATVYTQIGKAEAALVPGSRFNYIGTWAFSHSKNAEEEVFDYEILTCIPDQQTTIAATSTSQTTTSTTLSTTTITSKPCGTFVKYDIVNGRTDPELYGVLGGIDYRDGSLQYVGYGNNNNPAPCAGQNPCPGYINTNATAPGIYMSCAHGLFRDTQSVYYLEDHPDLMWVATNSANMMSVPNTIKLAMDQQWPFMFGRTTFNGQLTLGKAHAGNTFFLLNFFTTFEERYLDNFEVLTCTPGNTAQRLPVKPTTLVPTPTVPTSEPLTTAVIQTTPPDTSSTSQSTTETTTSTPQTTTSTTITTTTITAKPCGTFVKYDIVNGRTDPELYGVLGGIDYRDGSLQYVGYGNNDNPVPCGGQNPCPGYINTNATAPGIYMSCFHGLFRDTESVYYLEDHPDLMWVATNSANMMGVPNTIKLAFDQQWPFMFGRTTYNGQLTLGKVHAGTPYFFLHIFSYREEKILDNFEVLTCTPGNTAQRLPVKPSPTQSTTIQPASTTQITCPVSSCGTFVKYDIVNGQSDPENCGFLAGQYVDGTSVYVGYAENTPCNGQTNIPARIKTSNPNPGAYLARCGPEVYEPNTAYYLQKNDKLVWVKTTKATLSSISNALSIKAGDFTIYYARVNMTSTATVYTQIGKAEAALVPGSRFNYIGTWAFSHSKNAEEEVFDYEILTCIPDQQTTIAATSTSQTTTSTTLSTTTITSKPCGTFVKYDIVNGRTDPELYGVLGGIDYRDGSLQYVGYGNNNNPAPCAGQNPCPGYINTNATAPGIYMSCAHGLFRDTQSVYYLEDHPDLMWVATNSANMMSVPNTIKLAMDQQWPFMFGRTTYNGQLTLGKAHAGNTFFLLNFFTTREERYLDNFEVLTCTPGNKAQRLPVKPTLPTTTATQTTSFTGNINCGDLLSFNGNDVTQLGFDSGTYIDGSTVYVGTGDFRQCYSQNPSPARITVANNYNGQGAYMQCLATYNFDQKDPKFFPKHENLKWILTNTSSYLTVEGALKIGYMYAARINVTTANGTYQQIGKVYGGNLHYRVPDTGVALNVNGEFEILACTVCSYSKLPEEPCCTNGGRGMHCCTNGANNEDCCLNGGKGQYCCTNGADNVGCVFYQCGQLLNLVNGNPAEDGFEAGTYIDGSTIYPGVGSFKQCFLQNPAPARVMKTDSVSAAYSPCIIAPNGEFEDRTNGQYYYDHPDLKWVPTTAIKAYSVAGAIKVGIFYIGRRFIATNNGTYVQVGKVEGAYFRYKIPGKTKEVYVTGDIDVLACVPCTNGGSGPFCCLNGANNKECLLTQPCGATATYPRNNPTTDGFWAGTYQDGSKVLVGTGDFPLCYLELGGPARIVTEFIGDKEPGAYQICGNAPERLDITDPRYFIDHPNLEWVQTNGTEAYKVPGVVKTGLYQNMVGRFNYITPNGIYQTIGKVQGTLLFYYQPGETAMTITYGNFEVLTCQDKPVNIKCGTLLQFTSNNITEYGFDSGTYVDGSTVYVGTGDFRECYGQYKSPARMTTANSYNGQGAYMQCGSNYNYDNEDPRFFAKHNDLHWVMTNGSSYLKVEGALLVGYLYAARINVTTTNGTYQQIGKLYGGNIYYRDPETGLEVIYHGNFEVLACSPCSYAKLPTEPCCTNGGRGTHCCTNGANNVDCCLNGGKGKYCCTNGADNKGCIVNKCGFMIPLNGNDPNVDGFEAGTYIDGSTIYPGSGSFKQCLLQNPAPARIMTAGSSLGAGAYSPCLIAPNGEFQADSSAQYYYDHPDLKWVPTTAIKAHLVAGAVKLGIFYVGRRFIASSNGTYVQVGKVEGAYFRYKVPGKDKEVYVTGDIDVLACVPCTNGGSGPFCCLNGANNKECLLTQPCGATVAYPRNNPTTDGFWAGTYQDGSKVLAGTGDYPFCYLELGGPARILTEFIGGKEPGAYQICGVAPEKLDISDPRYFIDHPNMVWVDTNGTEAYKVPGVVKTGLYQNMVGRFNYITQNGIYQTIGKVQGTLLHYYQPGNNAVTLTSGSFEVLTCQDRPVNIKCGTLLQFTSNNITEYGFDSGTYVDGSTVYVGTGDFRECYGQYKSPARMTTANSYNGQGAYMQCGSNYNYDNEDPRFFAKHNDLHWVMTNGSSYLKVEGALLVGYLYAARINVTTTNGTYQQIGKLYGGNIYYRDPETGLEVIYNGNFEVLACSPCSYAKLPTEPCCTNGGRGTHCCTNGANNVDCCLNGGKGKYCCTNGADNKGCIVNKCGFMIPLNGNDPNVDGFEAGTYIDGSTIYPGSGSFKQCLLQNPAPARIMTAGSSLGAGAYSPCLIAPNGEFQADSSAQYYYDHPDLKWVPTTAIKAHLVAGAVKLGIFYVGRRFIASSNGTYVQVGKVEGAYFRYKVPGKDKEVYVTGDIDVLACVPCTNGGSGPFCCLNGANNRECLLSQPCGATVAYPRNNPTTDGFWAGTYQDGSKVLVGTGDYPFCYLELGGPARILTEFIGGKEPGAYQICGVAPEKLDISDPRYFLDHPNMAWVDTNGTEAYKVPGVVKTGLYQNMVGRFNYITPNGIYQTIGKVQGTLLHYYQPGDNAVTLTSGYFEVLTCQDRPVNIKCGTLLQFTSNNITEYGFDSGTYVDGSTVYVGTGDFRECYGQYQSPARLTTSNNYNGQGAYMQCGSNYNYDNEDPRFFAKHENLHWIMTNGSSYLKVEGILRVGYLYAARINVTTPNGTYQQIGKLYGGNIYYRDQDGMEVIYNGNFEVLACTPCPYAKLASEPCCTNGGRGTHCCTNGANNVDCCLNGGKGKYCCTNGADNKGCIINKCGFLRDFNGNDPSLDGFEAGRYYDGSTIYVGTGDFTKCYAQNPAPARIMTTNSISGPGAYSPCLTLAPTGENYDAISPKYFYKHPDLKWVPTKASKAHLVAGAIKVGLFYVGRKWMASSNGTYQQVGKIIGGEIQYKIPGETKQYNSDGDIDVLACVACTNGGSGPFCCANGANNKECLLEFPCGTTAPYPRNDPSVDGFLSGTYQDGSKVYPGTAEFACTGFLHSPARIKTEFISGNPGGYMTCGGPTEQYEYKDPRYYLKHSDLSWVQTTGSEVKSLPGVIKTGPANDYYVARFNYITPNGTIYQTIGKVIGTLLYFLQPGDATYTITTGAFEVLTCQPRTPVVQCGTRLQFTVNDVTTLGFPSGTYIDGSTVYPGTGDFSVCGQDPSPARISLSNSFKGPGAYMHCGAIYNYDEFDARFFANHANLRWFPASLSTYKNVEGIIPVGVLNVGRINVTLTNGTYQQIGKVYLGYIYYRNPTTGLEVISPGPYEVLACSSCSYAKLPNEPCCTNGGRGMYCCLNGANNKECLLEKCGYLYSLAGNDPSVNGFVAGKYIDGSTIYAGIGNFSVCAAQTAAPARIMTTNSINGPGAYSSCALATNGEYYDATYAQYYYNHPDLRWVPTNPLDADIYPGAVKSGIHWVGRIHLPSPNGTYQQIGKFDGGLFRFKIPGKDGDVLYTYGDVDVLACSPCTNGGSGPYCCTNGANNPTCTLNPPCGTLVSLYRNDPSIDGFMSGTFIDGSPIYPGTGLMLCTGSIASPARITNTFVGTNEPGAYMICGGKPEQYDARDPRYFLSHPNLAWVKMVASKASTTANVLKAPNNFMYARVNLPGGANGTYQTIGKIVGLYVYYYSQGALVETLSTTMEVDVLSCIPDSQTTLATTSGSITTAAVQTTSSPKRYGCSAMLPLIDNNPSINGFVAGRYIDGSNLYIGSGNFSMCAPQAVAPARITFGAFGTCVLPTPGEYYDAYNAQYFVNSPDLRWVPTTPADASTESEYYLVPIGNYLIGRVHLPSANGTYQQVGKIETGIFRFKTPGKTGETAYNYGDIDVLVCEPCVNGGSGPYCCTNGANNPTCTLNPPCGTTVSLLRNDPSIDGFVAGTYIDGTPIYVGTGLMVCTSKIASPARISNSFVGTNEPGAYMICGAKPEQYDNRDPRYFLNHPNLAWVKMLPSKAATTPNVLKAPNNMMYARLDLPAANGTYQTIGKITGIYVNYYTAGALVETLSSTLEVDVLTCQPDSQTTLAPTTSLKNYGCSALIPLIDNDPSINGFVAGKYIDGSTIYVGSGNFSMCAPQAVAPARITFGAFGTCVLPTPGEYYDAYNAKYFFNHPYLRWVPTTPADADAVPGSQKIGNYLVGRVHLPAANGTYQQVGKIETGIFRFKTPGKTGETAYNYGAIDVLVCEPCVSGGSGPYCCTNGANNPTCTLNPPCGTTVSLYQNDPSIDGFVAGTYIDGTPIYVGTGLMVCTSKIASPARISNSFVGTNEPGAYMICGAKPEQYDNRDPRYFLNHPNLAWVKMLPSKAATTPNVLKAPNNMMYARLDLPAANGTYQTIGKITGIYVDYYTAGALVETLSSTLEVDVLTCQP